MKNCAIGLIFLTVITALPSRIAYGDSFNLVYAQEKINDCREIIGRFGVVVSNEALCFYDNFDKSTTAEALRLLTENVKVVVVNSNGGLVNETLKLANAIVDMKVNVIVDKKCLSSCANYIFTAGNMKVVSPGGAVCWHGGPARGRDLPSESSIEDRLAADAAADLSDRFLARVNVRRELFNAWPAHWTTEDKAKLEFKFWCYQKSTLEERFNVRNIIYYDLVE